MTTTISGSNGVDLIKDGTVVQADLATSVIPIGVGQTWQDVTASRALGVTYTNDTGRPIQVSVMNTTVGNSCGAQITVDGALVAQQIIPGVASLTSRTCVTAIVPGDSTYSATNAGSSSSTLQQWRELR